MFRIFKYQILANSKIHLITGKIFIFIKESYTGGIVEIYTS